MADTDAILRGGPRDGTQFQAEGAGLIELEIDGMVHRYIPTTQQADGHAVYTYDGMVNPRGAEDGVASAAARQASPLADQG
ncbi:hypothetical protein O7635_17780 [Asanoa sp. WMMD1127]|uniref:hypothetical protein n=1 Tax=Asanoa sp. WMMD1127 TaxID=3016107 RepID=UPI0024165524|nr:hypothetical protein [Asanoa sp. WMMD1127]MDG4823709.1 hypothetical protein [Asanoa sp. WMMD1127]